MNTRTQTKTTANAPAARLRQGHIQAAVWKRTVDKADFYSVTFERRYRDSEGKWQTTYGYGSDDLLKLAKLADQAHSMVTELRAKSH